MENTTKTVARINKVNILLIENGSKLVPIRPICEALGIDDKAQRSKIENDEILGSVKVLSTSTGADGKLYEMFCIPFKFVFGWLFTINAKNVNPSAKEAVLKYKLECYEALYKHFTEHSEFLEQKSKMLKEKLDKLESIKLEFHNAKEKLDLAKKEVDTVKDYEFEKWKADGSQMKIEFKE